MPRFIPGEQQKEANQQQQQQQQNQFTSAAPPPTPQPPLPFCVLCGTTSNNVKFCSICKKFFCDGCRRRYPDRIRAMMQEKLNKFKSAF